MVVDGFEIFAFQFKGFYSRILLQYQGDVAHHVFHEFRVVVCAFGHIFFIRPFEQAVKLAGCLPFHPIQHFFDFDGRVGVQVHGNV